MDRTIKFRAWDLKDKLFIDFGPLYGLQTQVERGRHADSGFRIMQCTELQDMNRKDLYEGDIVRVMTRYTYPKEMNGIKKVIWGYGGFCLEDIDLSHTNIAYPLGRYNVEGELEIIGNIYENPELLSDTTHKEREG